RHPPGERRRRVVELLGAPGDAVLGEDHRETPEGVRLDHLGTHLDEVAVQPLDDVGPRVDQDFVAALELGAAEVRGRQLGQLEVRAGGSVEDDDPLAQRAEIGGGRGVEPAKRWRRAGHGPTRVVAATYAPDQCASTPSVVTTARPACCSAGACRRAPSASRSTERWTRRRRRWAWGAPSFHAVLSSTSCWCRSSATCGS